MATHMGECMQRASSNDASLSAVRDEFPEFRIWREITGIRTRYVARRLTQSTHPHSVVTSDLPELHTALSAHRPATSPTERTTQP